MEQGFISIYRKPDGRGILRPWPMLVNSQRVKRVHTGQNKLIPVAEGTHTIQVKLGNYVSNLVEINVKAGLIVSLECGYNMNYREEVQNMFRRADKPVLYLKQIGVSNATAEHIDSTNFGGILYTIRSGSALEQVWSVKIANDIHEIKVVWNTLTYKFSVFVDGELHHSKRLWIARGLLDEFSFQGYFFKVVYRGKADAFFGLSANGVEIHPDAITDLPPPEILAIRCLITSHNHLQPTHPLPLALSMRLM